jgi:hypothetical protein
MLRGKVFQARTLVAPVLILGLERVFRGEGWDGCGIPSFAADSILADWASNYAKPKWLGIMGLGGLGG